VIYLAAAKQAVLVVTLGRFGDMLGRVRALNFPGGHGAVTQPAASAPPTA